MVVRSRYLIAIVAILALYEFCSQILDFQFSSVLAKAIVGGRHVQAYLGQLYLVTNILALLSQIVLTTLLLRRSGPGAGLVVLPAAMCFASGGFWLEPTLVMGSLLIIADNGLNYSINQTSREMLFVPTSSDAQYKARAFTNMFIQRLAKGAAMVVSAVFILIGIRWLSPITLVITVAWIWLAILAGRGFRKLAGSKEPVSSELAVEELVEKFPLKGEKKAKPSGGCLDGFGRAGRTTPWRSARPFLSGNCPRPRRTQFFEDEHEDDFSEPLNPQLGAVATGADPRGRRAPGWGHAILQTHHRSSESSKFASSPDALQDLPIINSAAALASA